MIKNIIYKTLFFVLSLGFAVNLQAHVELDSPQGGETFTAGETITLQWHIVIAHNTLNWDLLFSSDGGNTWETIELDIAPGGVLSYQWQVPETATSQARVMVIMDNSGTDYQDSSNDFTIMNTILFPAIDIPAQDTSIACSTVNQEAFIQSWLDNNGGARGTSFCENLTWTHDFVSLSDGCGATGDALVTFVATDDCGNSSSTSATITIEDNTAPELDVLAQDMTIDCNETNLATAIQNWLDNQAGANANESCGNLVWTNDFSPIPDSCNSTSNTLITFTVSDDCGNISTTNATLTLLSTLGISGSETSGLHFEIFPNPAREILKLEFDKENLTAVGLSLFDALGKRLWFHTGKEKQLSIPVTEFAKGIYFLQVESFQGVSSKKILIE